MRIAVMGAGGTGGYFGGLLAKAGQDVTFIARGAHLEELQTKGLTVKSTLAGDFTIPVEATFHCSDMKPVDLVIFCVKTYDTQPAAELIQPIVGPETLVFSIQNGIDNRERIGEFFGKESVMCAVAQISSVVESPGVIDHRSGKLAKIIFGEVNGTVSPRCEQLLATFQNAGIAAEIRSDISVTLWEKFIFICAASGLTALTRLTIGAILACPETKAFLLSIVAEAAAVGRAAGVDLPQDRVDTALDRLANLGPQGRGSMGYDLIAGRRLELETLNGAVVRLGREHAVTTPCNFAIYAALKPHIDGPPVIPQAG